MCNDKKDQKDRERDKVYKDSKANQIKFGASIMTAQEVMPCDQPGGG